jgi:hypothetical protein
LRENHEVETKEKEACHHEDGKALNDLVRVAKPIYQDIEEGKIEPIAAEMGNAIAYGATHDTAAIAEGELSMAEIARHSADCI